MSDTKTCLEGGLLAGTKILLPDDPHEYYGDPDKPVACNHLVCDGCGCPVKVFSGYRKWGGPKDREEFNRFYESDDATAWPFLTKLQAGDRVRVYRCRCNSEQTAGVKPIDEIDLPWRCAGHPGR